MADDPDEPHQPGAVCRAFTDWVRETWPDRLDLVAIDGKTSRANTTARPAAAASRLRFATTDRLVLGQETTAIAALIERLADEGWP